jgi:3-dehydrosphinganine reductase
MGFDFKTGISGGHMEFGGKVVLITGGSSGIGLAVARQLAGKGAHVWILGRNQERLASALEDIRRAGKSADQRFGCLAADVADPDQVAKAVQELEAAVGTPDVVITSAGVTHPGYLEELPLEIFREMMDVNYFGTVYTVKAVLPGMLKRHSGTIVTVCSGAGYLGLFGYTAYGASKYAIRGFSDSMRAELKPKGIKVSIVFPQDTDTPQLAYENQFKPYETKIIDGIGKPVSAESVAEEIVNGVARGRYMIVSGFENKFFHRLSEIIGTGTYLLMDYLVSDALKKKAKLGLDEKK